MLLPPAPVQDRPPADLAVTWFADQVLVTIDQAAADLIFDAWAFTHGQVEFVFDLVKPDTVEQSTIVVKPAQARMLADAWETYYAAGAFTGADRPLFLLEAAALKRAAAYADHAAGRPMPELVPVQLVAIPGGAA